MPRNPVKSPAKVRTRTSTKKRRAEWLALRIKGLTHREIADKYGVHISTVQKGIESEIVTIPQESADEYRAMIIQRYEQVTKQANVMIDAGYISKGCDLIIKASTDLRKLLGLDAAEKQDINLSGAVGYAGKSEAEIRAIAQERFASRS